MYILNYPKYTGKSGSLVDALKALGIDSSFNNRKSIAALNGYTAYSGTASQNTALLNKLKNGTLIKSKTSVSNDWSIDMPSSVTIEKGKTAYVDIKFRGDGISSFNGNLSNSNVSASFSNSSRKPAGQWCSVRLNLTAKSVGTTIFTFKLNGSKTANKSITINTVNNTSASYEKAWFPAPVMRLTQLAYESYSHRESNVIDISPSGRVFAPFTGKVVYKNENWGYVMFQSLDKVQYADGSVDYLTIGLMHDSNISDLYVGQVIRQGQEFYDAGGMGAGNPNAYAKHVEIGLFRGRVNSPPNPSKLSNGNVYAYDALFINTAKTSIVNKGRMESGNYMTNGAPSNWSNLWRSC